MAHGSKHFDILAPRSNLYQGPFGRICPDLPAWKPDPGDYPSTEEYLKEVANKLMVELPEEMPADIAKDPVKIQKLEEEFNSNIPVGYTYFGQFVDHDITFDPASSLMRQNDPNGLLNFRTPRLDLDSVYGAGPDDQPYLYGKVEKGGKVKKVDKAKMATDTIDGHSDDDQSNLPDLPRYNGRALIGDMRNDENAIVSQLQLAFLLAHNTLVDRVREVDGIDKEDQSQIRPTFEAARKTLRWLYQHIVWNDFIPRIVIEDIHQGALKKDKGFDGRTTWAAGLDDVYKWKNQPFMPVEFSVAAYRFGHSMVRNGYQTNGTARRVGEFVPLFDDKGADLRGFRGMTPENSIQWDWFLPMLSNKNSSIFPQMARKIDTKLSNALSFLPESIAGEEGNVLAYRNLLRGVSFDLPSGTSIARKWCLKPLTLDPGSASEGRPAEPDVLWYYILKEAGEEGGNTLGPVGSIIVAAVFAGLLKGDPSSFFTMEPCWSPDTDKYLKGQNYNRDDTEWTLASIIRIAGLKADGIGFERSALAD